jgi:lysophospholipase L1-like esterase
MTMTKILFLGDSITDMARNREAADGEILSYGSGYPFIVTSKLFEEDPNGYQIINRGISGDRVVDLYARVKKDVWNLAPDVLSIMIGANDVWHELAIKNGVDLERWEKVYRMLIEDTQKALPNTKIIICEPYILHGCATDGLFSKFEEIKKYAAVAKTLAKEYGLYFVPLQKPLDEAAAKYSPQAYSYDGIHPGVGGATLIANEWLKVFKKLPQNN